MVGAKVPLFASLGSWLGTRPGRSWNHVNIAVLLGLSPSFVQVITVRLLCVYALMVLF